MNFLNYFFTDVCWLRLDFESFTLLGPTQTDELTGGVCSDQFKITVKELEVFIPKESWL